MLIRNIMRSCYVKTALCIRSIHHIYFANEEQIVQEIMIDGAVTRVGSEVI